MIAEDNEWNETASYLQLMQIIIRKQTSLDDSVLMLNSSLVTMATPVSLHSIKDATGDGILLNQQGDLYRGTICEGVPSGKGVLMFANGCSLHGTWEHGKLIGNGEYHYNEDVWIPRIGDEVYAESSLYLGSEIYPNENQLFDTQRGIFPFAFEESSQLSRGIQLI